MARSVTSVIPPFRANAFSIYALPLIFLLILLGCSLKVSASERDLRVDADTGAVLAIEGQDDTLWMGTSKGLFRWEDAPKGRPEQIKEVDTGTVRAFLLDGNALWIGAENGLFYWDNPRQGGMPHLIHGSPKSPTKLLKFGERLLIGATGGLFIWQNTPPGELKHFDMAGPYVKAFSPDGENKVWIGTDRGLLSLDQEDEEPKLAPMARNIPVTSLYNAGPALLIGTSKGLLLWDAKAGSSSEWVLRDAEIYSLHKDGSTFLISTVNRGLFRWGDTLSGQPELVADDIGTSFRYSRNGSILWMGAGVVAEAGLYQWDISKGGKPRRVAGINTGSIRSFHKSNDTLWIGAARGLFRLDGQDTDWKADVQVIINRPKIIYSDYRLHIEWQIGNYGWRTTPEEAQYRVVVKDAAGNDVQIKGAELRGQQEFDLPPLSSGKYKLYVQAADLNGKVDKSDEVRFQVYSSLPDFLAEWVKIILLFGGPIYFVFTLVLFAVLILLSRRWKWAFEFLTEPWVRKPGLYFGFALSRIRVVRVWVFERYYQELKKKYDKNRPYAPITIETPGGSLPAYDLLKQLHATTHILVQGEPGTGKTELLKRCLKSYCELPTLRAAYRLYGFIPVIIPLREFGDPTVMAGDSTIPGLAQAALKGMDMWFTDEKFFERLIRRKDFLIILDGLNEVSIDRQVVRFAATSPQVKLLMTSQTALSGSGIETYHLSTMMPHFAKTLLAAFIGEQPSVRVFNQLPEGFWNDIKSGYDVRLIQNLFEAGRTLPTNRLELYATTMTYAVDSFGEDYPAYVVYRHAWNMWKEKNRRFVPDEDLTDTYIKPLLKAKIVVARGTQFEFRHDLMRGYLAACWAVSEASSIGVIKERLSEDGVWELSASEQTLVFPFLAELINTQEELQEIAQFAADKAAVRMCLLIACQAAAINKGWSAPVNLNGPSPDLLKAL